MKKIFIISLTLLLYAKSFGQIIDSTLTRFGIDSLTIRASDSLAVQDTVMKKKIDVDAVVYASASDSLTFDVRNKKMFVFGSGDLKYKQSELKSGKIDVNFGDNTLDAFGLPDTSDPTGTKYLQTPVLTEAGESYEGQKIKYNFKTQRGFISLAKNRAQNSRYEGEKVKKIDKGVYFIDNGMYTTCDADTPHTHFQADEMKVMQGDKIIAKWIFMYIGGVPFPIPLPFGVFPNQSGRRSGIIAPGYGYSATRGQYFRNFGYFWAINDYVDLALTGDFYMKGGYGARSRIRYAKRYDFSGSINGGFSNLTTGEESDPGRTEQKDWNIAVYHNQQFDPTSRLDVNLQFQSSSYLSNNSISYNDLLTKNIVSNATFSKQWDESGNSISVNYSRTQNLETGDISEVLPNISFNKPLTYPFKSKISSSGDQAWYEYIGYNYSAQFRNDRKKTSGDLTIHGGVQHNISSSASPKIGYFNISPRVSYSEKWYNKYTQIENYVVEDVDSQTGQITLRDSLVERDVKKINFVRTFDFSVSASTKLYGIFNANFMGIEAFRHTITPSITYNYRPDFSEDKWGYYDSYTKANGDVVRYDKYQKEVFGGVSRGEQQNLSFSVGNVFELKTMKDLTDTTSTAKKIQLLNLNLGMGYNFAADSLKLSDLNVSYRTQIGELLNFSGSSSYTFYDFDNTRKINKFLSSQGKGLFRLTNFNFSLSTSLSGDKISGESRTGKDQTEDTNYDAFKKQDYIALYDEQPADFTIPWDLNLSYNYNFSKPAPMSSVISSTMSLNLSFSLTKNWKFTVRGGYDFIEHEISAPQITIYRDLHCWEMNFTWNPLGTYRGFFFEIRMKAPELKDIKVTKSKGLYSGRL
ncbi:MAG: organic solvent tolerance protein [Ignavibacteria bacterium RBG_13_36_8]|nr:MAG: organic solvent tolerance protein [Ignavibacteria bacterium RBG_13_36_8]